MRVLLVTVIAVAVTAIAGPASGVRLRLGAQVYGANNSLTGELPGEGKWKGRTDLGAGLVAEFDVAEDVALSFQPGFIPRDARQEFEEKGEVVSWSDYDLTYFTLPLLVRVTGGDRVGVRGFVTAGLDVSILIDATVTNESGSEDISDDLDATTIGALFGAGAIVPVRHHSLTLELRYLQGLNDIVDREGSDPESEFSSPSVKYRGFNLMIGFLFTLGGE